MLDTQINMYSIDTGTFYSNHEKYLHDMNCKYRRERNFINNKLPPIENKLIELGYNTDEFGILKRGQYDKLKNGIIQGSDKLLEEYLFWNNLIVHKRNKAHESKNQLLRLLSNKMKANELSNGKDHIRTIREDELHDNNVISVFESSLSRITSMYLKISFTMVIYTRVKNINILHLRLAKYVRKRLYLLKNRFGMILKKLLCVDSRLKLSMQKVETT